MIWWYSSFLNLLLCLFSWIWWRSN